MRGEMKNNSENSGAMRFLEPVLWVVATLMAIGICLFQKSALWGVVAIFFFMALVSSFFKPRFRRLK